MFRDKLLPGLLLIRSVDHVIEAGKSSKPANRPFFQLPPVRLRAMKSFVQELLGKRKTLCKSLYGAPMFYVKERDKALSGLVDYQALNRITKSNSSPLRRWDEKFDMLEMPKCSQKRISIQDLVK